MRTFRNWDLIGFQHYLDVFADIVFFWGKKSHYYPVLSCFPDIKNKAVISGSPVVDAWNIAKKKFVKKHNDDRKKILISVNFARADKKLKKVRLSKCIKNRRSCNDTWR